MRYSALTSIRSFFNGLYWQDFLTPGIECALAWLLEFKDITVSDIWVYTRVVEDSIDMLLTRSRQESTLANMRTHIDRVADLSAKLVEARSRGHATCEVDMSAGALTISDLEYSRGTVTVKIPELTLKSGLVYAVTGANGCGKSTSFSILAGCGQSAIRLPAGIELRSPGKITVPSDDIVEITQNFYCPLYIKPISWMLQRLDVDQMATEELQGYERRIDQLSSELVFRKEGNDTSHGITTEELHEEKSDWYSALSGGQKVKVEFIRKVFLRDTCPGVLLIDEAFAPLDPASKVLVQQKLKEFCGNSLMLVIYHSEVDEGCVSSADFFSSNLHFANGTASLKQVC